MVKPYLLIRYISITLVIIGFSIANIAWAINGSGSPSCL